MCGFLHSDNSAASSKKSKTDSKSEKGTIALIRGDQNMRCVSQVELLEQTLRPTYVRRSILEKIFERILNSNTRKLQKKSPNIGNKWDHLWKMSRVDQNIIATPTRLRLRTETQTTRCGRKGLRERKQLGSGPKSCSEFAERAWRTKRHSSNRR